MQHVDTKSEVRFLIAQHAQDGRQDIYLLGNLVLYLPYGIARVKDNDRRAESPKIRLVFRMVAHIGMIAGEHEDGVLKPGLPTGCLEEFPDGHIGIADTFLNGQMFLRVLRLILFRHDEGMVARSGEDSRHEGLLQLSHLLGIVLQEGFVPDSPSAVEIVGSLGSLILRTSEIMLEPCLIRKSLKAHRTVLRPVEESRLIALGSQDTCQSRIVIHRSRRQDKRFHEHRDAGKNGGHTVNALSPVAEAVAEGGTLADERIHARRIAPVFAAFEAFVQGPNVLAPEALHNQDHHILPRKTRIPRATSTSSTSSTTSTTRTARITSPPSPSMHRRINPLHLLLTLKIIRNREDILTDRTDQRKRRIEHQRCIQRTLYILIGIRQRDGAHGRGKTASHSCNGERNQQQQRQQTGKVVSPP